MDCNPIVVSLLMMVKQSFLFDKTQGVLAHNFDISKYNIDDMERERCKCPAMAAASALPTATPTPWLVLN